ncbi:MAG: molybdopterin biosynthesis protein, partial [Roseovarius sp.]|nr:molybdopterin biosynthesis protein [Roseovarius sp.]
MKFGPLPIDQAIGAILAHSEQLPGGRLRKGVVLDADHLKALRAAGFDEVTVARLESGDLHEDAAAAELARALLGQGR